MDKKRQPKLPAQLPADKPETGHSEYEEEFYEQAPRQKTAETVKERERADLLPVKVDGELVYRRDAKTEHQSLPAVRTITLSLFHIYMPSLVVMARNNEDCGRLVCANMAVMPVYVRCLCYHMWCGLGEGFIQRREFTLQPAHKWANCAVWSCTITSAEGSEVSSVLAMQAPEHISKAGIHTMQVHAVEGITIQEDEPDEESVSPMVSDEDADEDADEDDDISSAQDAHEAEEHASSGGEGDLPDKAHPLEAAGRLQQATSRQAELQVWHLYVWAWLFRPAELRGR